jgi:hypothetical protein
MPPAYLWPNWRILLLCVLVIVVALILFQDRNRNRFILVPDRPGLVLDTRTGQFCIPWPASDMSEAMKNLPRCSDLANGWR